MDTRKNIIDKAMSRREFLQNQFETNASLSPLMDGLGIQPNEWERQAREFQEQVLVLTTRAEVFNMQNSKDYTVTIEEEPEPFKETDETDPVNVQEYDARQVTFEPQEYTEGFETSWTNIVRTFITEMARFSRRLGYASGLKKDQVAAQTIYDAATAGDVETIYANDKADRSSLTAGDGLTIAELRKIKRKTLRNRYVQLDIVISPEAEEQLLGDTNLSFADRYGGAEAIRGGVLGQVAGFNVVTAHSVALADSGDISLNIALGQTMRGERALGHAVIRPLRIEEDYKPKYRRFGLYGHEDYDFKVLHPNAIFVLETHNG